MTYDKAFKKNADIKLLIQSLIRYDIELKKEKRKNLGFDSLSNHIPLIPNV